MSRRLDVRESRSRQQRFILHRRNSSRAAAPLRIRPSTRVDEYDFLQVLAGISVTGKNVKNELEGCLKLRKGCGHLNTLRISDAKVAAHIETLLLSVFEQC